MSKQKLYPHEQKLVREIKSDNSPRIENGVTMAPEKETELLDEIKQIVPPRLCDEETVTPQAQLWNEIARNGLTRLSARMFDSFFEDYAKQQTP